MKKNNLVYLFIFLLYEEIIFSSLTIVKFENIFLKVSSYIIISIVLSVLTNIFNKKINKIMNILLTIFISIIFCIYFIYYKTFGTILSIYSFVNGTQVFQFSSIIIEKIFENWYAIIIFFIPIIFLCIIKNKLSYDKINKKEIIIKIVLVILFYLCFGLNIQILSINETIYSPKNLYYNINNPLNNYKNFGLLTTIRLDMQRTITKFKEKDIYQFENEDGKNKVINIEEYNMLNIDFEKLILQEENDEIKEIHNFIKTQEPTKKNKYTGMFSNKNLIVVIAESFSTQCIMENTTPTLYKMYNSGIQFKNFYTPLFPISTADGEYATDLSLLPAEGTWSIKKVSGNIIPYSYPNIFAGYNSYAYHNYKYNYYDRDKYLETLGYGKYLAQGNGLENRVDFTKYPSSDYEMIKNTIDDYINDEHFIAYYMTMSGHMNYDKNNDMVKKNFYKVENLPYSEKVKSYLATQIELDKALEELINKLKEKNKLEDTVIIITGDHYPYGLSIEELQEISKNDVSNIFNRFKMPFIIYNTEVNNIIIEKEASSIDVLPTMLNLFGIKYDSRLLIGKDILSDINPLVIFPDRSFITEIGKYNSMLDKIELKQNEYIHDTNEYIEKIRQKIYYKYKYSRLILEKDYYKYLQKYL